VIPERLNSEVGIVKFVLTMQEVWVEFPATVPASKKKKLEERLNSITVLLWAWGKGR
jgi:hypothetical protein